MERELEKLRESIDSIDKEILELILKRMECVEKVGELKGKNSFRIYVPERENAIFKNLYNRAKRVYEEGKITQRDIENIFTEIISFCRSKERKLKVFAEDYNCFFIGGKIFGSCIEMVLNGEENSEDDFDFKILKFQESKYKEIFLEEKFKFIVSYIDFSGEYYIILGKESNGISENSYTGIILKDEQGKLLFQEYRVFEDIKNIGGNIKKLGSYEKRKI